MERAYHVSDARHHRPGSATNGQGLPPGGCRRLKKLVQESGRRLRKLKLASLNVGSMTGRNGEKMQLMRKKNLQVLCVQETKWKGRNAREIGAGYKMYYHGEDGTKNGVGIVLSEDKRDRVLSVERTCDRVMRMKLEIEVDVWHIISCYAPQVGCTQVEKYEFWEHMDAEMQAVPRSERLVVTGDLNGHVGRDRDGYDGVHGGHGLGVRNEEGIKIMDLHLHTR